MPRAVVLVFTAVTLGWPVGSAGSDAGEDLERVNLALRHWLRLIDADRPYVVVDGSAGEVRLQHGAAVLRQCPVVGDSLSSTAQTAQKLTALLRRYRRTDPFHEVEPGPFDWEHYLVTQATDEAAMLFSGGLLLFASEAWEPARPPAIRLHTADLRALHDAAADSMDLVLLPAGWEEGR